MKVLVYQYVYPRVTNGSGTEITDVQSGKVEELDDCIESSDPLIIASFLNGLANQYDPKEGNQRTTVAQQIRILIEDDEKTLLEVKSSKLQVVAHMLRGAAKSIIPHNHAMRGTE